MLFTINQTSTMGHLIAKAAILKVEMANVKPNTSIHSFVRQVAEELAKTCKELGASEERIALIKDDTSFEFAWAELIQNKNFTEMLNSLKIA